MHALIVALFAWIQVVLAQAEANITVHQITKNDDPYFSDPFHVPSGSDQDIYLAGTTHKYLHCSDGLRANCAVPTEEIDYKNGTKLTEDMAGLKKCGVAGIHPLHSADGSWDAVITMHISNTNDCSGDDSWAIIVHAHPGDSKTPPQSWIGDKVLVGSLSQNVGANYDGKYFRTPEGELHLIWQKQYSTNPKPKRDGVVSVPMKSPDTIDPDGKETWLLRPDDDLNSENYIRSNGGSFKLIETANIRVINHKFVMAYSVGAYFNDSYKIGIAYSDTFLPAAGKYYRKVMKENPDHLWKSQAEKEVYYLLQSDVKHEGWHYVKDKVLAPGVPTLAPLKPDGGWALIFAGYEPGDGKEKDGKYTASHRRPYFIDVDVAIPENASVEGASDEELQGWVTPRHG